MGARPENAQDADVPLQGDRDDVSRTNELRRHVASLPIHPHMSVTDELCRKASGLHHAREPEPLIEPLPFGHAAPFDPSTFADDSTSKEI